MAEDKISHDEARSIAMRLIAGSFRRDGEVLPEDKCPRFSIPTRPDRDDDTRIVAYILQQKASEEKQRGRRRHEGYR